MFSKLRKLICLLSFVLVLSLVGDVQAVNMNWTDTTSDHNWFTAGNWDIGAVPTSGDNPRIYILPGAIIANKGAVATNVYVGITGAGTSGALTVDGGTLTAMGFVVSHNPDNEGTINMISGAIECSTLTVGFQGSAIINMTGGTFTVRSLLKIADKATAIAHVNLHGGIMTAGNFEMRTNDGSVGTMDIRAGTLIINGDKLSLVQGYIDNGWITAYGGRVGCTLHLDYDITNEGKTTLTATSLLNPSPADGALVSPGTTQLSWTLPDPCVPGQPVPVDVYFTDDYQTLEQFTDPAAIQVVSKQDVNSVVVQTQPKTRYYWAVDTYIGDPNDPIFGPIFSFYADNFAPEADAGADVVTWLEEGVRTGNLDGAVTDDGAISPYTVQWTVVSEPNDPNSPDAVITDPSAEDTSITLAAAGEYVLQLEAFDGEYTGSDTVTINVYNDSCQAAQSLPDYEPFPGDLNGDCIFDDLDMAILQEDWLKDNSLAEEWFTID